MRRVGLTIIELLVSIAIIGVLVALLLPAVQAARESARQTACRNNLRQIAVAASLHVNTSGHFPTDGWGYRWIGDPNRGFDEQQPGGWIYNLLPYVEQVELRRIGKDTSTAVSPPIQMASLLRVPVAVFHCPSRRPAALYPYTANFLPLFNCIPVPWAAKTDYAICAGDTNIDAKPGPPSTSKNDFDNYAWPLFRQMSGVSFIRSQISAADIRDGLSQTLLVGEKHLPIHMYLSGESLGDDQTMYLGDDADIRRWTSAPPVPDSDRTDDIEHFGGPHSGVTNAVFCDGSVQAVSFSVESTVYAAMGNRLR